MAVHMSHEMQCESSGSSIQSAASYVGTRRTGRRRHIGWWSATGRARTCCPDSA